MTAALHIGQPLPELNAQTADGQATTAQAYLGDQRTLLYFLHGTWCAEYVHRVTIHERNNTTLTAKAGIEARETDTAPLYVAVLATYGISLSPQPRLYK